MRRNKIRAESEQNARLFRMTIRHVYIQTLVQTYLCATPRWTCVSLRRWIYTRVYDRRPASAGLIIRTIDWSIDRSIHPSRPRAAISSPKEGNNRGCSASKRCTRRYCVRQAINLVGKSGITDTERLRMKERDRLIAKRLAAEHCIDTRRQKGLRTDIRICICIRT